MSPAAAAAGPTGPGWPETALLSLAEKRGAEEFARALVRGGTRLFASAGTAEFLARQGLEVTSLERLTGFAALLGGRVKTLHPHVHGPILARRAVPADLNELAERGLEPIDLVAVSLYPFALDEAGLVEEIDVGGVARLRAAAKNHADVIVVHDPERYGDVLQSLEAGGPSLAERRRWAAATFARTARYDAAIAAELARRSSGSAPAGASEPPPIHVLALERVRGLRYGENPHQIAALYARAGEAGRLEAWREGKELSYNNLLDLEAAVRLAGRFEAPACAIVKHNQPCGVACADSLAPAWSAALAGDELSAYGGVVAFNRPLDGATAGAIAGRFVECVAAPDFEAEAAAALGARKNLRLVRLTARDLAAPDPWSVRLVGRWALLQGAADGPSPEWRVVTHRAPAADEWEGLRFAWEIAGVARSNAIAIARGTALVGLGSGQTSRIDALDVAIMKARRAGHDLTRGSLASDGFFPFADNVEHAAAAGITAIVQPGGAVRDPEVIAACDRAGIAMAFTDRRVFRH